MTEQILNSYDLAYEVKSVALRYFNAAGADPLGSIGEDHNPESHLIPLVLKTAQGQRKNIKIFGDDYKTEDGTCVRDYVHVCDLADAHVLAYKYLENGGKTIALNLGSESGTSVKQIIDAAIQVTKVDIATIIEPKRKGDPAKLVANALQAKKVLGWKPNYDDINKILESAWNWHQIAPNGFKDLQN